MMARAFSGKFELLRRLQFRMSDGFFTLAIAAFLILVRIQ
jgi:hypothetical protein